MEEQYFKSKYFVSLTEETSSFSSNVYYHTKNGLVFALNQAMIKLKAISKFQIKEEAFFLLMK